MLTGLTVKMDPKKQQEVQRVVMEGERQGRILEESSRQFQILEAAKTEIDSAIQSLEDLKDMNLGTELLVPVGSDTFIRAGLKEKEEVLIGIGAGISVDKSREDVREILEGRKGNIIKTMKKVEERVEETRKRISQLNMRYEDMVKELEVERK